MLSRPQRRCVLPLTIGQRHRRVLGAKEAHVPHPTLLAWLSKVGAKATAFLQETCLLARLWPLAGLERWFHSIAPDGTSPFSFIYATSKETFEILVGAARLCSCGPLLPSWNLSMLDESSVGPDVGIYSSYPGKNRASLLVNQLSLADLISVKSS